MKTKDLNREDLEQLQQKAVAKAIRENKALKLAYRIVSNGQLILVHGDGRTRVVGPAKFGTVKVQKKKIKLKN